MILVSPALVGPAAFRRLVRDRVILPLAGDTARPWDVPDSAGLRALTLAPRIPPHTVLTGLAALWVHGWLAAPPQLWQVVGRRGLHRTRDPRLGFHAGATARMGVDVGALRVAPEPRACLDALRWDDAQEALAVVVTGMRDGRVRATELQASLAYDPSHGAGFTRLQSLVRALRELEEAGAITRRSETYSGLLPPVTRRAS